MKGAVTGKIIAVSAAALFAVSSLTGCGGSEEASDSGARRTQAPDQVQAPAAADADGWINLSADPDLGAWTMQKPGAWKAENGVMSKSEGGGYIWTKERFGDFVFECDFKIEEGGNSGIFFRTDDIDDPAQTGIEMQVYNTPRHPSPVKNDCGAIYDLKEPSEYVDKPAGVWNHVVISCDDNIITVTMNGTKIVDMDIDEWDTPGMNPDGTKNKFTKALRDFARDGHIGFQEHGDPVWYRNVRIKRIRH